MKRALILGAGFSACSAAQRLLQEGRWEVLMVSSEGHLGEAARTRRRGIHLHTLGPQLYSSADYMVLNYLNSFQSMECIPESRLGAVGESTGSFEGTARPAGLSAQQQELNWLAEAGRALHVDLEGAAFSIAAARPSAPLIAAYPRGPRGYDEFFESCTQGATLLLNTKLERIDLESRQVRLDGQRLGFDVIINTLPIDDLFGRCYGPLKYIGMQHTWTVLPVEQALPAGVHVCYHRGEALSTRSTEYKKLTGIRSDCTLLGLELPVLQGRSHALPFQCERQLASRYASELPEDVFSIGSLGAYRAELGLAEEISAGLRVSRMLAGKLAA